MEVAKVDNSQVNFNGYVDKKFQRTLKRAVKMAEKEFKNKPRPTDRDKVFFSYEKRILSDLNAYMEKFDKKTVLTTVPTEEKGVYTFALRNTDLKTDLGFKFVPYVNFSVIQGKINVAAPAISKTDSPEKVMQRTRYFLDNFKRIDPKSIEEIMYSRSKNSGELSHLRNVIKALDNYILLPVSIFQRAWTKQYNKIVTRFGHLEDKLPLR